MSTGNLAYSWSRRNRREERADINVYTTTSGTWDEFVELMQPLKRSRRNPKTDPGYITAACTATVSSTGKEAAEGMFYRCNASVTSSSLAYADVDSATPEEFATDCEMVRESRFAMMLYTTASHTEEAPRYRIVMPVRTPVTGGDIIRIRYGLLTHFLKGRDVDSAGFTLSQPMYRPPVGSQVIVSESSRMITASKLMEGIPEINVTGASDYKVPEGEQSELTDLFEEFAFEFGGRMTDRGLQMPATPEHAAQYTTGEPKQDDFLFCWPRDGFERPNVTLYHDTDLVATGGMKPGGRDMWAYACAATGLPFDRVEVALGWAEGVTCDEEDLDDEEPPAPQADFIVEGYVPSNCIWDIVGESGTYKSFYTLGMMYISAAGYRFAGADTRKAHHFYIDGEGGEFTHTRIAALAAKYGDEGMRYMHVLDAGEFADTKKLVRKMRQLAGSEPVGMVAFDTLNQTFGNWIDKFNENSAGQDGMGRVVAMLKEVRDGTKGAVGVVHHTPKGGSKARGSGALYAGVDVELTLVRATEKQINVAHTKNKNGMQQKTIGMVLEPVQFREAPPPKEFQAVEFSGGEGYGEIVNLDLPEPHKALVLMPWGFEPFETDEEKERNEGLDGKGKDSVKDTVKRSKDASARESVMSALEDLQQADDTGRGFTQRQIVARAGDHSITNLVLEKMLREGELMLGCDENGEVVTNTYRLPTGIDDRKRPKNRYEPNDNIKTTEGDLE
ncbi:AAA family ATPase [Salmonella enterica subsp. enterica serovar Enteritidis]|nr:hypothetical protein [Salmonella enterica subsp. enterica serovar Enteritidis]EEL7435186.1 AAA family ATPase [Salmonella enterica subsp. enterica serovar Enteritidis]